MHGLVHEITTTNVTPCKRPQTRSHTFRSCFHFGARRQPLLLDDAHEVRNEPISGVPQSMQLKELYSPKRAPQGKERRELTSPAEVAARLYATESYTCSM